MSTHKFTIQHFEEEEASHKPEEFTFQYKDANRIFWHVNVRKSLDFYITDGDLESKHYAWDWKLYTEGIDKPIKYGEYQGQYDIRPAVSDIVEQIAGDFQSVFLGMVKYSY